MAVSAAECHLRNVTAMCVYGNQAKRVCDLRINVRSWQGVVAVELDGAVELDDDIATIVER